MTREEAARLIDHSLLRPAAIREEVERHCREAVEHGFRAVVVHPCHLRLASEVIGGARVILASVVAFPHGASTLLGKIFESLEAIKHGAAELDVVLNLSAIASGDREAVEEEVRTLMEKAPEVRHKFIVETGLFGAERLVPVLKVMNQRRPAFVKTSTGVNARGATVEDVEYLRSVLHPAIGVKAAGGVRTIEQVAALAAAGATCIGTSAGVEIVGPAEGAVDR